MNLILKLEKLGKKLQEEMQKKKKKKQLNK